MNSEEICYLSAGQLGRLMKKKELSPVEVIKAHLSRIESLEPKLNSFITLLADQARTAALQAEKEIQQGKYRGPLHGIPLGLKDLYYVKGIRNTAGTKVFDSFVPEFDSTVAAKLKEAGTILLGKLNMHPLAYGLQERIPITAICTTLGTLTSSPEVRAEAQAQQRLRVSAPSPWGATPAAPFAFPAPFVASPVSSLPMAVSADMASRPLLGVRIMPVPWPGQWKTVPWS